MNPDNFRLSAAPWANYFRFRISHKQIVLKKFNINHFFYCFINSKKLIFTGIFKAFNYSNFFYPEKETGLKNFLSYQFSVKINSGSIFVTNN